MTLAEEMELAERRAIEAALTAHGNNRTHAARALGISLRTLRRRLRRVAKSATLTDSPIHGQNASEAGSR